MEGGRRSVVFGGNGACFIPFSVGAIDAVMGPKLPSEERAVSNGVHGSSRRLLHRLHARLWDYHLAVGQCTSRRPARVHAGVTGGPVRVRCAVRVQ